MKRSVKLTLDYSLIGSVGVLLLFGLLIQSSAGTIQSFQKFGDGYFYFKRYLGYFVLGLGAASACFLAPVGIWRSKSKWLYGVLISVLLLVFIPGIGTSFGTISRSWAVLGPLHFQPVEVAKFAFIVSLAGILAQKGRELRLSSAFLKILARAALPITLVALQPDLGSAFMLCIIAAVMLLGSEARNKHLLMLVLFGILCFALLVFITPGRFERVVTLFDTARDTQGAGYHINQALIGIGSGGWLGVGLGHSRQKFNYLPEATGDSIFVIIAEEFGFIVTTLVVLLYAWLGQRLLKAAHRLRSDGFARSYLLGIFAWVIGQAFINMCAMIGLLPLTGITLPFMSYGGTALVSVMAGFGIAARLTQKT